MLSTFLNRYQQIQTLPETELATPYYHEIRFRVLDNDWWIQCLQRLTKALPEVCFSKRYVNTSTFGFQWSVILFGPREREQLEEFCRDCDQIISDVSIQPVKSAPEIKTSKDRQHVISEKVLKDESGKVVGEVRKIQLNCEETTMNAYDDDGAPRVFSGSASQMAKQVANAIGSMKR